jgi:hypothetical protein
VLQAEPGEEDKRAIEVGEAGPPVGPAGSRLQLADPGSGRMASWSSTMAVAVAPASRRAAPCGSSSTTQVLPPSQQ